MKKYISKISILGLILFIFCVSILMIPTQAYFTKVVTSVANVIRAANYDLQIAVKNDEKTIEFTNGDKLMAGEYEITLTPKADCAEHGFCVIKINGKTYYTVPIEDKGMTLTLKLDTDSAIRFIAHWGEAENYEIDDSEWTLIEGSTLEETTSTVVSLAQAEETTSETTTTTTETAATETTAETTTTTETAATETTAETTTTTETAATETTAETTTTTEPAATETTAAETTTTAEETTTEEITTLSAETTAETTTDVNSEN